MAVTTPVLLGEEWGFEQAWSRGCRGENDYGTYSSSSDDDDTDDHTYSLDGSRNPLGIAGLDCMKKDPGLVWMAILFMCLTIFFWLRIMIETDPGIVDTRQHDFDEVRRFIYCFHWHVRFHSPVFYAIILPMIRLWQIVWSLAVPLQTTRLIAAPP